MNWLLAPHSQYYCPYYKEALLDHRESECTKKNVIVWAVVLLVALGIILGLVFGLQSAEDITSDGIYHGLGAVVSNGDGCADIGGQVLAEGGSAVDAAIATLICEGVILPHSMGVGGGFVANIYTRATGRIETLIARETAPGLAHQDMFVKHRQVTGVLSAAVPSEIYGYWKLHQKYGKVPWKRLFKPTVDLCKNGHKVSKHLANVLELYGGRIRDEPSMAEIFINPVTNEFYREGDIMYRPQLGETLRIIAEEGPETMYRGGRIGKMLVQDVQAMGGIITEADLQTYQVRWEEPLVTQFTSGFTLYTTPLPTSGAVLTFILNVLEPMYTSSLDTYWQRMVETFKHAYGHRTNLGDLHYEPEVSEIYEQLLDRNFAAEIRELIKDDRTFTDMAYYGANFTNEEDHGTANIAVLGNNGDAIVITSSINSHFGAKVRSRQTGIILNDEMDDFSTPGVVNAYGIPASPANYIKPGKRPLSSMCPSIVLDKMGNVRLIVGGAGGAKITTSVAQTVLRYFVLNQSVEDSINAGRLHHQLAPMYVDIEPEVPMHTRIHLLAVGHEVNILPGDKAFSALTAIGLKTGRPEPACDRRRRGGWIVVPPPPLTPLTDDPASRESAASDN